jgi:hypothetical protein
MTTSPASPCPPPVVRPHSMASRENMKIPGTACYRLDADFNAPPLFYNAPEDPCVDSLNVVDLAANGTNDHHCHRTASTECEMEPSARSHNNTRGFGTDCTNLSELDNSRALEALPIKTIQDALLACANLDPDLFASVCSSEQADRTLTDL